jgi:poly-gamma-glutamate synthesis protein (capsule biosynthesis protein)
MKSSKKYFLIVSLFLLIGISLGIFYYSNRPIDLVEDNNTLIQENIFLDNQSTTNLVDEILEDKSSIEDVTLNNKTINILSFGDMMLDRYIRRFIDNKGITTIFENITPIIKNKDMVVANLEGSISNFPPKPLQPNNVQFTFDPKVTPELKKLGFTHFSLANNHSRDFGTEGIKQTKEFLDKEGIKYFGDSNNKISLSYIQDLDGFKIGLIGYHELFNPDTTSTIQEIKNIQDQSDFIIVYPHWGIEYKTLFSKSQQEKAYQFIDAGADAIIGAHPHVIQPIEIYKNKAIFYSLGNFVFDQTFSQNTQQGLAVNISLTNNNIVYEIITLQSKNLIPYILEGSDKNKILSTMADNSVVSDEVKSSIKSGSFNLSK